MVRYIHKEQTNNILHYRLREKGEQEMWEFEIEYYDSSKQIKRTLIEIDSTLCDSENDVYKQALLKAFEITNYCTLLSLTLMSN